jgi:phage terminase large subunit
MAEVKIQATKVYYRTREAKEQIIINRGGARSSKSYSLGQLFLTKFLSERNKKILIVRKTLPSLRISTLSLWKELLYNFNIHDKVREEKLMMNYYYGNNLVHFGSIDNPEKIKSSEWNYIWMEEATEFKYTDFQQLKLRLSHKSIDGNRNQMYLSFNPVDEFHWIKTKVLDNPSEETREIHSTYRDNPYLSEDYITILEGLINQDMNFYRIYAEGEWGKLDNLIYGQGWSTVSELDEGQVIYGLDFGFNAPTALVKCVIAEDGSIWEEELLYQTGLTNTDLIKKLEKLVPNKERAIIYADSAEPDRILEIKRAGFVKVKPADKSVKDGIDFVKTLNVRILKSSENLIKERRSYSWKVNKMGETIDEPVEFMDHLMDAERYALYTHLRKNKKTRLRWL